MTFRPAVKARRTGLLLALVAVLSGIGASTAEGAVVTVNPFVCYANHGGAMTVPAGSQITVRQGFAEQTRGILTAFLQAQTSAIVLGGTTVDVTDAFSLEQRPGDWVSFVTYETGITLGAGDSLSIVWHTTLDHVVPEVFNPAAGGPAGQPAFNAAGSVAWSCTVTAAA
jgi:hypothetical protein